MCRSESMYRFSHFSCRFFEQGPGPKLYSPDIQVDCVFGFVMEIIIYSTWGDQYYCGLNGIELYDAQGDKIQLEEQSKQFTGFYTGRSTRNCIEKFGKFDNILKLMGQLC